MIAEMVDGSVVLSPSPGFAHSDMVLALAGVLRAAAPADLRVLAAPFPVRLGRRTELRPDLVLLDVKMPVLDGLSAAEQIVAARIAPVVILTAFSQRDLVERAREAGVMAYLVKPFQKKDLLPAIEMAASRFSELVTLEREVGDLTGRLEARKLVDRAKGVLQSEHAMSEPDAFRFLQRRSMDTRRSMRAVAQDVLDGTADAPVVVAAPVTQDDA